MKQDMYVAYKKCQKIIQKAKKDLSPDYQSILYSQKITPPVPGLIYIQKLLSFDKLQQIKNRCLQLYESLNQKYNISNSIHKSYNHNLVSDKYYKLLNIKDINKQNNQKLDAQMFKDYGSKGHDLTYFIDIKNIPNFVKNTLVKQLENIDIVKQQKQKKQLNWRLTFNIYKENDKQQTPFLWHKDIAVNGKITSITTVLGEGQFQIRHQSNKQISYKLPMTLGSLVVLSGDSRWKWEHRAIRIFNEQKQNGKYNIQRISLVLGCK